MGGGGDGQVVAGLRPESFEDASMIGDLRDERGVVFDAEIDLVESLGSDLYAYFHVESGGVESEQLADLVEERLEETGVPEVREGQEQIVARLDPASKIKRRDIAPSSGPTPPSSISSTPRAARASPEATARAKPVRQQGLVCSRANFERGSGMRKRFGSMAILAVVASVFAAPSASAATEVGNDCTATSGSAGITFVQLAKAPGSPLPIDAPAGVVTKWKVNSAVGVPVSQQLVILRPTGTPNEFLTVAESASVTIANGPNSFETRIPVQAGDRMGAAPGAPGGPIAAGLYCATGNPADSMGVVSGDPAIGSINAFTANPGFQVAISAIVEPDADGDGYGDETQDKCPQLATVQAVPCPLIVLDAIPVARKGSVTVLVTTNNSTSVTVSGAVKVAGKAKKTASSSALLKLKDVTAVVNPGSIASISLAFPAKLKSALKALPPKRSLSLTVTASATNPAGQVSIDTATVKLKGQARSGKRPKR